MKEDLDSEQILLVSTLGNVWKKLWRICILILGCKGLILYAGRLFLFCEVGLSSKCHLHVTYEPQDVVVVLKCHFNFSGVSLCPSLERKSC